MPKRRNNPQTRKLTFNGLLKVMGTKQRPCSETPSFHNTTVLARMPEGGTNAKGSRKTCGVVCPATNDGNRSPMSEWGRGSAPAWPSATKTASSVFPWLGFTSLPESNEVEHCLGFWRTPISGCLLKVSNLLNDRDSCNKLSHGGFNFTSEGCSSSHAYVQTFNDHLLSLN